MRYTLAQNAISSLSIAIEYFKKFYYSTNTYSQSEQDEATKICIIFLENSIELMIKTILASTNPLSIYKEPKSRKIRNALSKIYDTNKLEDILIAEGNFKTITYTCAVEKYNDIYHNSEKVYTILRTLGETRNAIMHFGIDETETGENLIVCILNAFDVIYNYLYPQLVELEDIGDYFTNDDLIVQTVHGERLLLDDNNTYNNILDFLDELLETSEEYVCSLRAANPESKINDFTALAENLFRDAKFTQMLTSHNAQIEFEACDFEKNSYHFIFISNSEIWDVIYSCYSIYHNVTAFCGEIGNIYFLVEHNRGKLYVYRSNNNATWPQRDEAEPDEQWLLDCANGFCKELNLSKRNLLLAFDNILTDAI